jgi:hypothetical protein
VKPAWASVSETHTVEVIMLPILFPDWLRGLMGAFGL